jgi:CRP-like cAMP-binding protein
MLFLGFNSPRSADRALVVPGAKRPSAFYHQLYDRAGAGCDRHHTSIEKLLIHRDSWKGVPYLKASFPHLCRPNAVTTAGRRLTSGPASATVLRDHRRWKMVINSLSVHPCFRMLDPELCRGLDRQCAWLETPAGAWVEGQADNDRDVYFVLAGRLRATRHGTQQDLVFTDIEAGSFFGELGALDGASGSPSVLAVADSTLAKMPSVIFVQAMFNHRPLGEAVVATLVARNRAMTRKVAEAAQTCANRLPSIGPGPRRPAQSRFDAVDDIRGIGANPRRARRWL